MPTGLHAVIGIDLGTTYSAVATYDWDAETPTVLRTDDNKDTVPSVVGWDPVAKRVIVGEVAKRNMAICPGSTVFEIKREMGAIFSEKTLAIFDPDGAGGAKVGEPARVSFCGEWRRPQEISAFTLMRMKEIAERSLNCPVLDAVITVPAWFTEKQRRATEEAARLAGLYPRQLIPEPTAAAICYGVDNYEAERKTYLVYDLGGGTFDVSIIVVQGERIEVVATSGDPRLGGGDFDDAITEWAVGKLKDEGLDISQDRGAREIVKFRAEELKKQLSMYQEAQMPLLELRPAKPPTLKLTRPEFEAMIQPLIRKSLNYIDMALRGAEKQRGIQRKDIDAVLLVGGSSKIPMVKGLILEHFQRGDEFVRSDLNPDQVVARGAAVLARRFEVTPGPYDLHRTLGEETVVVADDEQIFLITEHSLGIRVNEDDFARVVAQGTQLPVAVTRDKFTNGGPYTHVPVEVYQGEGQHTYENDLIGVVPLGPMEPRPAGEHQFEVTFSLDKNGLLSAVVHHVNAGQRYAASFVNPTGVGGAEALAIAHKHLHELWGDRSKDAAPPPVPLPSPAGVPPPLPPVPPPLPPPSRVAPVQGRVASETAESMHEMKGEPPEQFRSIVRRVRKHLLQCDHAKLRAAYVAFVDAADSGVTGPELEEFGDSLEEAYLDARAAP